MPASVGAGVFTAWFPDTRLCAAVILFAAVSVFGRDGGLVNSTNFRVLHLGSKYLGALDTLTKQLVAR